MEIIFGIIVVYVIYLMCLAYNNVDMAKDKAKSIRDGDFVYRDLKGNVYLNSNDHKVIRSYDKNGSLVLKDMKTQKPVVNYTLENELKLQELKLSDIERARLNGADSYMIAKINDDIRYMLDGKIAACHYGPYNPHNSITTLKEIYQVFEWEDRTCILVSHRIHCEEGATYYNYGVKHPKVNNKHFIDMEFWVDIYTGECKPRMSKVNMHKEYWYENDYSFVADFDTSLINLYVRRYQDFIKPFVKDWSSIGNRDELNQAWLDFTLAYFHFDFESINEIAKKYYRKVNETYLAHRSVIQAYKAIDKALVDIEEANKDGVNVYDDGVVIHYFFLETKETYTKGLESNIDIYRQFIEKTTREVNDGKKVVYQSIDTINAM